MDFWLSKVWVLHSEIEDEFGCLRNSRWWIFNYECNGTRNGKIQHTKIVNHEIKWSKNYNEIIAHFLSLLQIEFTEVAYCLMTCSPIWWMGEVKMKKWQVNEMSAPFANANETRQHRRRKKWERKRERGDVCVQKRNCFLAKKYTKTISQRQ